MIHNDVINQLQLLVKTASPPLVEVAETPLEQPQFVPGQRLTALVLVNQPNGRFQVQVGEQVLDMNLPRNTQPGEQLELTFVSNQPRLTFVLSRDLAAALANAAAPADAKAQVTVSDSARFLGGLLQKIAAQAERQANPLSKATPLLSAAPADIKEFGGVLRNALSQSGLFYESHQAQWVAGERKLSDLLQEPQGRLSPNMASLAAAAGAASGKAQTVLNPASALFNSIQGAMPETAETGSGKSPSVLQPDRVLIYSAQGGVADAGPRDAQTAVRSGSALMGSAQGEAAATGAKNAPLPPQPESAAMQGASKMPVHAEVVSLVQQQLQTLDSRQLVWQGQVWPGQEMEWRVEERNAREGRSGEEESINWQTSLRLQLPSLGNVQATLAFIPQGLRINLKAADEGAAGIMQGAQDRLLRSMEAAGLHVLGMAVERDETA